MVTLRLPMDIVDLGWSSAIRVSNCKAEAGKVFMSTLHGYK